MCWFFEMIGISDDTSGDDPHTICDFKTFKLQNRMNLNSVIQALPKTAVDTLVTAGILDRTVDPAALSATPIVDHIGTSWQAPVIAVASSVIIQLTLKLGKFLIGVLTKKLSPKPVL